jgi:hypothetical protein
MRSKSQHILAATALLCGAVALVEPAPAVAQPGDSLMVCPYAQCVDTCPDDLDLWCFTHGCNTYIYNCAPFGMCDLVVYCGST